MKVWTRILIFEGDDECISKVQDKSWLRNKHVQYLGKNTVWHYESEDKKMAALLAGMGANMEDRKEID